MTNRLYPQTALLAEAVEFTGRHTVNLVSPNLNFRTPFYVEDAEALVAFCVNEDIEVRWR
jgi:hypothetical protein